MKKSVLNIGKLLSKEEQKSVSGGFGVFFNTCPGYTKFECLSRPQCAWNGKSCITDTPHIV